MYAEISDAALDSHYLSIYAASYGHDYFDPTYDDLDVLFDDEDEECDEEWEIDLEDV